MLQRNDTLLDRLLGERLKASELPLTLDLSGLHKSIEQLWKRSAAQSVEWGGCLVLENGQLLVTDEVKGSADAVSPRCKPEDHNQYVGFLHTHLEDRETGDPYIGFSDRDYTASILDGDHLSLVTNGRELFGLVQTSDCSPTKSTLTEKDFEQWRRLFDQKVREARSEMDRALAGGKRNSQALNRRLREANQEMCRKLGFAFYQGRLGERLELVFSPQEELS